ncbi:maleylpyruvate isomerase family mycothiol-dependent enzyme [Streptomyces sp. NPDC049555]|uniref:maleylpyruvate isomerase family mycothiol-dependent enzyme n=1 Tax=Streptomyces sp. NPDC049555 TaxID=3154930 RepID=UPI00342B0ABB
MTLFSHERYCAEVLEQTAQMRELLRGADLSATVPTCPDWTLAQLVLHVSSAHRGVAERVRDRVTEFVLPKGDISGIEGAEKFDADSLDRHLAEGAEMVVEALREAGPDADVWTFGPEQKSRFWARRMTHETVMHRADVAATVGAEFTVAPDIAADCLDEWLDAITSPMAKAWKAALGELTGPGRTLHLHATDTPAELQAEWLIDATGEEVQWRRSHEKAAVAVRGPMTDLLGVFYRRLPADTDRVEIIGDRAVLDHWLERTAF